VVSGTIFEELWGLAWNEIEAGSSENEHPRINNIEDWR
jgi:hypothetical protein